MTVRFALPDVGEGLHEAEIVRWLVTAGERVARDQPLVEILTDKAQVELPSPAAGVVRVLAVDEGAVVPVGTVLVEIDDGTAVAPGPAVSGHDGAAGVTTAGPAGPGAVAGAGPAQRPKASPSTRKLAARLGVDLAGVTGTGPGGRILAGDVEVASRVPGPGGSVVPGGPPTLPPMSPSSGTPSPAPTAPASGRAASDTVGFAAAVADARPGNGPSLGQLPPGTHPLRGIRRLTAASMAQSWSTIPHITGMDEADATALLEARRRLRRSLLDAGREAEAAALTPLVLLAAAVARTLRRFPLVNAAVSADGTSVTVYESVDLGIAVATADGLIVPVVRDADRRDLVSLAGEMQRLAAAARDRTIGAADLRGGTFTLTNYGALGGRFATPLILPGQAGIMGFGAIRERPVVVDGAVVARPTLPVVFSADHRIIDGDLSVAFQEAVLACVAEPLTLLLGV